MKDRRTPQGYKLRVYLDQIAKVKSMTNEEWLEGWIQGGGDAPYVTKTYWIFYLEQCAMKEAYDFLEKKVA
jgi:hypothetical protein